MLNLGIVGLRNIGKNHVRNAMKLDGVKVLAGADSNPQRLAEAKAEFAIEKTFHDAEDLFADNDIDAVILALPNHLHAPLSIKALEAGKHVLVEKPICRWTREAEAMINARDRSGKLLMVGMNQRFSPQAYALKQAIADGIIGRVYLCKTFWNRYRPAEGLWGRGDWFFLKEKSGGGPLLDLGIHKLDLLLFLLGFPKILSVDGICFNGIGRSEAAKRGKTYEIEDMGMGVIRFAGGGAIHLEASYFHNQQEADVQVFDIFGTNGAIHNHELYLVQENGLRAHEIALMKNAPKNCVEHFIRAINGEEELCSTPEQAATGLRIIEAIYRSSETGLPVEFDAETREVCCCT